MKEQILEAIKQYDTIIVHRHVRPDPDAYGSQGGLVQMLRDSFPTKQVYAAGEHEKSLTYLNEMDEIPDQVYEGALVIVCDTANQERVCDQRYTTGKLLIKIDHHPNKEPYGDLVWVDTSASSTSEMIYDFYTYGRDKGLVFTKEAAKFLYAGIIGDTGRFLFRSTTSKTFLYASELVEHDFSFPDIYENMYKTDLRVVRLGGYVLQHFTFTEEGTGWMKVTKELLRQFDLTPSEASQLVSTMGNVEGIKAWVIFFEEDERIRVRLRSKGPVINELAGKYNGGGHPLASGATVYSWEEADRLIEDLRGICKSK
jgi:bifunctional oligoribonuclease and PAP phosphatase NrnA